MTPALSGRARTRAPALLAMAALVVGVPPTLAVDLAPDVTASLRLRQRAYELMGEGKAAEAIPLLDAILRAAPRDGLSAAARGLARWKILNAPAGEDGFAWIQRQRCLAAGMGCADVAGALDDLGRAVDLLSGEARASVLMARAGVLIDLGERAAALRDEDEAVSLLPDDPTFRQRRAHLREGLGDRTGALADLDRAVALAPDDPGPALLRAGLREDLGDLAGALADLDAAVRLRPDEGETLLSRAKLHGTMGDPAAARADVDAALGTIPVGQRDPDWGREARALRRALAQPGEAAMEPELTRLGVARVDLTRDTEGRGALSVTFDPNSAQRFGDFTAAHVGSEVQLVLDGRVILSPRVLTPIRGGIVVISGSMSLGELSALAEALRQPGAALTLRSVD